MKTGASPSLSGGALGEGQQRNEGDPNPIHVDFVQILVDRFPDAERTASMDASAIMREKRSARSCTTIARAERDFGLRDELAAERGDERAEIRRAMGGA